MQLCVADMECGSAPECAKCGVRANGAQYCDRAMTDGLTCDLVGGGQGSCLSGECVVSGVMLRRGVGGGEGKVTCCPGSCRFVGGLSEGAGYLGEVKGCLLTGKCCVGERCPLGSLRPGRLQWSGGMVRVWGASL